MITEEKKIEPEQQLDVGDLQKNPEALEGVASSVVVLQFFRHAEKEEDKTKPDAKIELTKKGRGQATGSDISQTVGGDISQVVGFGSPRIRAQHTAGLVMAGQLEKRGG